MTALSAGHKPASYVSPWPSTVYQKPIKNGSIIYANAVVAKNASGEWVPASADSSLHVYGFARLDQGADSITGTGTNELKVDTGCKLLTSSGLAQTDEGATVYAVDDQTFSLSSSSGARPVMGKLIKYASATSGYVAIDPWVNEQLAADAFAAGAALTNADATIQITAGEWRTLPAATLTAAHMLTVGTTGAKAGDKILITRLDVTGHAYTITNGGAGAGTLAVLPGGEMAAAKLSFDGTNWSVEHVGSLSTDHVVGAALTDADATVNRGGRRSIRTLPAATLTADRTITLGTTSATLGDVIRLVRLDVTGFALAVVNGGAGAGTLYTLPGGEAAWVEAYFDGTNWIAYGAASLGSETSVGAALTDADATVQRAARVTWRTLPAATLTAARALTIGTTGAQVGDVFVVTRIDVTGHAYTITNGGAGAGSPFVLPGGAQSFAILYFDGTNWIAQQASTLGEDWTIGAALTDADATIQRGGRKSWRTLPAATLGAPRALTIGTTGAVKGDVMLITRNDASANAYTITNGGGGGGNPFVMPNSKVNFAELYFDGTNWLLMRGGTQ